MFQFQYVHFQVGNMTVLSYVKEMGGIHNKKMICRSAIFPYPKRFHLLQNIFRGVWMGEQIWHSEIFKTPANGMLSPKPLARISQRWGTPEMDLFASRDWDQISSYIAWRPDLQSHGSGAFQNIVSEVDSSNHFLLFHCKESSFEGQNRDSFDDTNHPELTSVTLGQLYPRVVYRGTTTFASIEQHVGKSTGSSTPSIGNKTLRLVDLECFRESFSAKSFSKRASKRISNARRPSTTSIYESSWCKWNAWCGEQKADLQAWHVKFVFYIMVHLFQQMLYPIQKINSNRSVIFII